MSAGELETLTREALKIIRNESPLRTENRERTYLLLNSRTDIALATATDGVHLPANDISPAEVRAAWKCGARTPSASSGQALARETPEDPLIAISCHSLREVNQAAANAASFAVFAPVFEKKVLPGARITGLEALRQACRAKIPVLALGGVTLLNAESCLQAGAAGIAAIRLFQENDIAAVVRKLRGD